MTIPNKERGSSVSARVCVPNQQIRVKDAQERAIFSRNITEVQIEQNMLNCIRKTGSTTCRMAYHDITALASQIEEVGYVVCEGSTDFCLDTVYETAVAIETNLRAS